MLDNDRESERRRLVIIEGISHNLTNSMIATQLGVNRWAVARELRSMRYSKDPLLKQAYIDKEKLIMKSIFSKVINDRFFEMTGQSFQEKSFMNMISYYKPELMRVVESSNEYLAIMKLAPSVQRTLVNNGIISGRKYNRGITPKARKYLLSR